MTFEVVAVGASLGGLRAVGTLLAGLPESFPCTVLVVQHRAPQSGGHLSTMLGRHCALPVREARAGDRLTPGQVLVAPADQHLMVAAGGAVELSDSTKVQHARPSIDVLFQSVATHCGLRAIGVLLTGTGMDGAAGVRAIKLAGGRALVQDPRSAQAEDMPRAAAATGCVDFLLPPAAIARALVALTMVPGAASLLYVPLPSWALL